jgi:glycosyltransferase involved in cell wall biosynthesis
MKIAFVNQPIDTVLPPYQNSVGNCTYGVVYPLSRSSEVMVYGLADNHSNVDPAYLSGNPRFRLIAAARRDRFGFRARKKLSQFVQTLTPISTSSSLYPNYGREVALDVARERPDVIHIQHSSQYAPVLRRRNPGSSIVLHLHAEWFSQTDPQLLLERLEHVDLLTTVSDYITAKTRRDFPSIAARCETMYNGIDASEFRREKDYPAVNARAEKRIVYTGAVSPHKGLHVLVDAFRLVVAEYPAVRLDILGPHGSYPIEETFDIRDRDLIRSLEPFYPKDRTAAIRRQLFGNSGDGNSYNTYLRNLLTPDIADKVAIVGMVEPRSKFVEYYYDADVFAFTPIWNEGFGLPPVEAMAAGTPVVASRSGAIVETVVDRETGFLVEKNDARATADAILALLRDESLRTAMGRAARRRALEKFTWDQVARSMYERYCALANSD